MNEVRKHVNSQFSKYPKTTETLELKEEVIGNLEAEIEDLQSRGISFKEAFRTSIEKMSNLDELIDGVKSVRMNKVMMEMMQWALIYTLIAWIVTIPLNIFDSVRGTSWLLFIIVIFAVLIYVILYISGGYRQKDIVNVDLFKIAVWKKYIWIIWFVFIIAQLGMVTAVLFGSNIWFWRPISIDGPYEFAQISTMYVTPFISIIIPLLMNRLKKVLDKEGMVSKNEE